MMGRFIGSYEEKMIMKSVKDQSIKKLDILKKFIEINSASISQNDIIEVIETMQKEIRLLRVHYR